MVRSLHMCKMSQIALYKRITSTQLADEKEISDGELTFIKKNRNAVDPKEK